MFYAEFCPYGLRTISEGDRVMRFLTRAERDEMVERINTAHWESIEGVCAPITRKEAARSYRVQDFDNGGDCEEVNGLRTCAGRAFFEVTRK